jgi:hypothetical protein
MRNEMDTNLLVEQFLSMHSELRAWKVVDENSHLMKQEFKKGLIDFGAQIKETGCNAICTTGWQKAMNILSTLK